MSDIERKEKLFIDENVDLLKNIFNEYGICFKQYDNQFQGCIYSTGIIKPTRNRFTLNMRIQQFSEDLIIFVTNIRLKKLGLGDGTRIFDALRKYARNKGFKYITANPISESIGFYEKLNFQYTGVDDIWKAEV